MDSAKHPLSGRKVVVAGAGIGGLAFAIGLKKQWPRGAGEPPTMVIYDRDNKADVMGREGYSLSLRSDAPGGIQALKKLGILDAMREVAVYEDTPENQDGGFCMWDSNWHSIMKVRQAPNKEVPVNGLRVARNKIRGVLAEQATKAGCEIQWGSACTGVRKLEDGQIEVQLSSGDKEVCDLVVAADGANSKLRKQVRPFDSLEFQEVVTIAATSRFDGPIPKPVDKHWGILLNDTDNSLFAGPVDDRSAVWSISWKTKTMRETKATTAKERKALLKEAWEHAPLFPPLLGKLLKHTDEDTLMLMNGVDKQPFAHTDSEWSGIVFIGDANHAITPFAGNGANMALCDGFDLADFLCKSDSIDAAVKKLDAVMVPRCTKVWKESHRNIGIAHATGWTLWGYSLFFRVINILFMGGAKSDPPEE